MALRRELSRSVIGVMIGLCLASDMRSDFAFRQGESEMKQKGVFASLPDEVKVGRKTYKISYHNKLVDEKSKEEFWGLCNFVPPQIEIAITGRDGMDSTLIHEILHAAAKEHHMAWLTEKKVQELELALFEILKKNKWVIKTK